MIVDDSHMSQLALKKFVKTNFGTNIEIQNFFTGEDAVKGFSEFKPNVIFMDIIMEGIDGIEASRQILQLNSGAKIIIVSANEHKTKEAEKLSIKGVIIKPITQNKVNNSLKLTGLL